MNLVGEILQSFDKKQMVLSVFVDLEKAFYTVPHSIILEKLRTLWVKGTELKWLTSYMYNRKQYVSIGNNVSEHQDVMVGVQQGSLLGLLLFQLTINDLPKALKFANAILYADDTTLYVTGRSLRFLRLKM